jgi:hypothetical protein
MNITSPHGYRTKQIQITQKYPESEAESEPDPYAYPVELAVTWTPIDGTTNDDVVSRMGINPKELKEEALPGRGKSLTKGLQRLRQATSPVNLPASNLRNRRRNEPGKMLVRRRRKQKEKLQRKNNGTNTC